MRTALAKIANPAMNAARMVTSLTDTRHPRLPNPSHRWWSLPLAAIALLSMLAIVVTALYLLIPSPS